MCEFQATDIVECIDAARSQAEPDHAAVWPAVPRSFGQALG